MPSSPSGKFGSGPDHGKRNPKLHHRHCSLHGRYPTDVHLDTVPNVSRELRQLQLSAVVQCSSCSPQFGHERVLICSHSPVATATTWFRYLSPLGGYDSNRQRVVRNQAAAYSRHRLPQECQYPLESVPLFSQARGPFSVGPASSSTWHE